MGAGFDFAFDTAVSREFNQFAHWAGKLEENDDIRVHSAPSQQQIVENPLSPYTVSITHAINVSHIWCMWKQLAVVFLHNALTSREFEEVRSTAKWGLKRLPLLLILTIAACCCMILLAEVSKQTAESA